MGLGEQVQKDYADGNAQPQSNQSSPEIRLTLVRSLNLGQLLIPLGKSLIPWKILQLVGEFLWSFGVDVNGK
jgi:hypothetical protein